MGVKPSWRRVGPSISVILAKPLREQCARSSTAAREAWCVKKGRCEKETNMNDGTGAGPTTGPCHDSPRVRTAVAKLQGGLVRRDLMGRWASPSPTRAELCRKRERSPSGAHVSAATGRERLQSVRPACANGLYVGRAARTGASSAQLSDGMDPNARRPSCSIRSRPPVRISGAHNQEGLIAGSRERANSGSEYWDYQLVKHMCQARLGEEPCGNCVRFDQMVPLGPPKGERGS